MKTRTVDDRIDRLARPQHGVVSLAEVIGNGITPDQLRARLDRGSLVRLDAGVYRTIGARSGGLHSSTPRSEGIVEVRGPGVARPVLGAPRSCDRDVEI